MNTSALQDHSPVWLSANEIESLCLKAARGAGASWGGAEETGFALAWLARQGVQASAALLAHLGAVGGTWTPARPLFENSQLRPKSGPMYPIPLGMVLSDFAGVRGGISLKVDFTLDHVLWPVLLLPFVANLSAVKAYPIAMVWVQGRVTVWPNGCLQGDVVALATVPAALITLSRASVDEAAQTPKLSAAKIPPIPAWVVAGLSAFALKTTVPASETSRAGAGAAATDND